MTILYTLNAWCDETPHPRIFFSNSDISTLRQKAQTTHAEIWQPILSRANYLLTQPIPSYPGDGSPNYNLDSQNLNLLYLSKIQSYFQE